LGVVAEGADGVGQAKEVLQERSLELLGIYQGQEAVVLNEILTALADSQSEEFVESQIGHEAIQIFKALFAAQKEIQKNN